MSQKAEPARQPGTLYVVATPIGNLEDITSRAARILGEVDLIACEDTRRTKKLLSHLGLRKSCLSYFRERERQRTRDILQRLAAGENVALVSDAGTPGLSDPGGELVRQAREAGISIVAVPGACALAAAVSVAGLQEGPLLFAGFPPAKTSQRVRWLQDFAALPWPLVLYEAPHRIADSMQDCLEVLGNRPALLLRELTKLHEEHLALPLEQLLERIRSSPPRGEMVLVISGATPPEDTLQDEQLLELLGKAHDQDKSLRETVARLSSDMNLPRNRLYRLALNIWRQKE